MLNWTRAKRSRMHTSSQAILTLVSQTQCSFKSKKSLTMRLLSISVSLALIRVVIIEFAVTRARAKMNTIVKRPPSSYSSSMTSINSVSPSKKSKAQNIWEKKLLNRALTLLFATQSYSTLEIRIRSTSETPSSRLTIQCSTPQRTRQASQLTSRKRTVLLNHLNAWIPQATAQLQSQTSRQTVNILKMRIRLQQLRHKVKQWMLFPFPNIRRFRLILQFPSRQKWRFPYHPATTMKTSSKNR